VADARADRLNKKEERVGIAIQPDFAETEDVAAGFTLLPEAIAGTGKKMNFAGALGLPERFSVEITEHQDFACAMILYDAGNKSAKFFECEFHACLQKTKNPLSVARQRARQSLISDKR